MTSLIKPSRRDLLVFSGMALVLASCSTTSVLTPAAGAEDETQAALPMVNKLRQSRGLSTLTLDMPARKAAARQAVRMAKANEMKHLIGFGDDFGARMKSNDVALPAAENIASGQDTVAAAVQAWIDSPKHLENMLGSYRGLGVAMARTSAGARPYWAMVLSG
ncbi:MULTISPECIES: CAP domain-containing protein [unclassified Neorhizobium]|uniref:CAP domain-containing protein n=1 Tax=unclassified Neorhizobium TaxID=2629175 RepID=UPI001FF605A8|nr:MULTISPECIES: CAP domain-containing protein [unclassified Neorhizobium]MCJ9669757.1 CAP domain-containing protein [Neorhizobium sp. SHOUNA12B]MCJ9743192.1 CAP domain-containing protein [Neorhizobium sp. SHOUNA12A]